MAYVKGSCLLSLIVVSNLFVILRPQTEKKYQKSLLILTSKCLSDFSRYLDFASVMAKSCSRPSIPAPRKSVDGSLPWNPISIHWSVILFLSLVFGIRLSHNLYNLSSWFFKPSLNFIILQWFSISTLRFTLASRSIFARNFFCSSSLNYSEKNSSSLMVRLIRYFRPLVSSPVTSLSIVYGSTSSRTFSLNHLAAKSNSFFITIEKSWWEANTFPVTI